MLLAYFLRLYGKIHLWINITVCLMDLHETLYKNFVKDNISSILSNFP
jgi:hypothetical protein